MPNNPVMVIAANSMIMDLILFSSSIFLNSTSFLLCHINVVLARKASTDEMGTNQTRKHLIHRQCPNFLYYSVLIFDGVILNSPII